MDALFNWDGTPEGVASVVIRAVLTGVSIGLVFVILTLFYGRLRP